MKRYIWIFLFSLIFLVSPVVWADGDVRLVPAHPDPKNPKSFSFLVISGKPGGHYSGEFAAVNLSQDKKVLQFSAKPAGINEKGEIIAGSGEIREDVSLWLTVPEKEVTIEGKERRNFPYALAIAQDAKPGDFLGTISSGTSALPVWVKIEGVVSQNFTVVSFIREIEEGTPVFRVKVKNEGNTVIGSLGFKIVLNNSLGILSGRKLESFWGEETTILPSRTQEFVFRWENSLPTIGQYRVNLEVSSGADKKSDTLSFFFLNKKNLWGFLLKMVLLLLALSAALYGLIKFRRKLVLHQLERKLINNIAPVQTMVASPKPNYPAQKPAPSVPDDNGNIEDQVRQMVSGLPSGIALQEEDYDKIWFKVRKIVREEIELWKEMENFRKEIKKELREELQSKAKKKP